MALSLTLALSALSACDSDNDPPVIVSNGAVEAGTSAGTEVIDPRQRCSDGCQRLSVCEALDSCGPYTMEAIFSACQQGCEGERLEEVTTLTERACEPALLAEALTSFGFEADHCEAPDLCEGQLCGVGFVCDPNTGDCVEPCATVECGEGFVCAPESGECIDPCEGVSCAEGSACDLNGECVNRCVGVSCGEAQVCEPLTGECKGVCEGVVCPQGETCSLSSGECVARCEAEVCAEGEVCDPRVGGCVNLCEGVSCEEGFVCSPLSGACRDLCDGVSCVEGWRCELGACVFDDVCAEVSCAPNYICQMSTGRCGGFFCSDDAFDRERLNNNPEDATPLPAGTQRFDDLSICLFDIDWYTLLLPANTSMRVGAYFSGEERGLNLRLYEGPNVLSALVELDNQVEPSFVGVRAEARERRFYVRVSSANGQFNQNAYSLSVEFNLPGELCQSDSDCLPNVSCQDALCGGEGARDPDPSAPIPAVDPRPVDPEPIVCTEDSYEPNQSFMEASVVMSPAVINATLCPDNTDLYTLELSAPSLVSATLNYLEGPQKNLDLYLLSAEGVALDTSTGTSGREEVSAELPAGRVYLSVAGASAMVSNDYNLNVTTQALQMMSECEDQLDPNDALNAARPLSLPASYQNLAICSDQDVYSFELMAGQTLTAQALFTHLNGDLDISLVSDEGLAVARSNSVNDDEELTYTAEVPGTYKLLVFLFNDAGPQRYDLNVSLVNP